MEPAKKDAIKSQIEQTKENINEKVQGIQERLNEASLKEQVNHHPMRTFLIAIGVGMIFSGTLRMLFSRVGRSFSSSMMSTFWATLISMVLERRKKQMATQI